MCCYFAPANESLIHFLFIQFFVAFGEKRMHDQPSECDKFRSILFIFVCLLFFRERFVCVTVLVFSLFLGLSSIQNSRWPPNLFHLTLVGQSNSNSALKMVNNSTFESSNGPPTHPCAIGDWAWEFSAGSERNGVNFDHFAIPTPKSKPLAQSVISLCFTVVGRRIIIPLTVSDDCRLYERPRRAEWNIG